MKKIAPYLTLSLFAGYASAHVSVSWWEQNQVNVTLTISLMALVVSLGILLKKDNEKKHKK